MGFKDRVRFELHLQIQITRSRAGADTGSALILESNALARRDAFRDGHVQRAALARESSGRIDFRNIERDLPRRAAVSVFDGDRDARIDVLAGHTHITVPGAAWSIASTGLAQSPGYVQTVSARRKPENRFVGEFLHHQSRDART